MIQEETDNYIRICMKTWLLCESCINHEISSDSPRQRLVQKCNDCGKSCFALVAKLVSKEYVIDLDDAVFDCLLYCRQCAMECEKYSDEEDIRLCGDVCELCGDALKELTIFSLN